jgi:hypothetical protein
MKRYLLFLALSLTFTLQAQAPQGFNYQATVRNSSGDLIVNTNVYFKFNVMQGSQTSLPVFTEIHYVPTDDLGQVNLVIGQGTSTTGTFSELDWSLGSHYLGIELDTGNGYVAMGTTQLLSVPYALYAESSGSSSSGFPTGGTEGQVLSIVSGVPTWTDLSGFIDSENLAEITTVEASNIDFESMTAGGNINDDGGFTIVSKGVVWSESPDPTPELETKTDEGGGASSFTSIITGLDEETEYFYRAYAITSAGTAYGSTYSFTTDSSQFYDQDGDGYTPEQGDCNDFDEFTHPGAAHNESTTACMTDLDGDGYGDIAGIDPGTDCNDSDDSINPGATELEDGVDNNCDGAVDYCPIQADFTGSYTLTFNGGGIGATSNAGVWGDGTVVEVTAGSAGSSNSERVFSVKCYPSFGFSNPNADFSIDLVCGNSIFNGAINNTFTGVGCGSSIVLGPTSVNGSYNGTDDSTFTLVFAEDVGGASCGAEGITSYTFTKNVDQNDVDNDGDGYTENQGDCDDNDAQINPGATEIEDGIDNDCDGDIDEGFESGIEPSTWGVVGSGYNNWGAFADGQFYTTDQANVFVSYVTLVPGEIKFRENNAWGNDFGDTGADGTLDAGGDNIVITDAGTYKITMNLNDNTYTIEEFSWGIVGSGYNDWGNGGPDAKFYYDYTTDTFKVGVKLIDGEIRVRPNNTWGGDLGDANGDGVLDADPDSNIAVTAGHYLMTINLNDNSYTLESSDTVWGLVGSGYNDWGNGGPDFALTEIQPNIFVGDVAPLVDGVIKFRKNNEWGGDIGDANGDNVLDADPDNNISVTAGGYRVRIDFSDNSYQLNKIN